MRLRWAGCVFLVVELLAQAQPRYVTDRTIVELRRGPSTEYLILRNLEAGERVEDVRDPDLETGLLGDLAEGGLLAGLTGVGRALRERPRQDVAVPPARTDDERRNAVVEANDDAAGRSGGAQRERWVAADEDAAVVLRAA